MVNRTTNAGVDALTGFALQRNMVLCLLLEDYNNKFKDANYFVCLEHHDDFIFCFLDDNDNVQTIEAYQSKKKSTGSWALDAVLIEIVEKLLHTGIDLIADSMIKSSSYKHFLIFISNQTINLKDKSTKASCSIKEDNISVDFNNLHQGIKDHIINNITNNTLHPELSNLKFNWIDFNRTVNQQMNQLAGQFGMLFKDKVVDHKAAVETLISLFRRIETTYNDGNVARLLDESKRVSSSEINDAIKVITTQSKCYEYWKSQTSNICKALMIPPIHKDTFKLAFESAFDLFKSKQEAEHRNILDFVKSNISNCTTMTEEENVIELIELFRKEQSTKLEQLQLVATFFAAVFEAIGMPKNNIK